LPGRSTVVQDARVHGWIKTGVRITLAALAALNLGWGAWAVFAPVHFFTTFPGLGHSWTAAYPPFNDHLVSDLGATFLTLGVLLAIAAVLNDRTVTRVVLAGVVTFNALHLAYHLGHHGLLHGVDLTASLVSLAVGVLAPVAVWIAVSRGPGAVDDRRDPR
jgi:hypothetical protein